jgi:hypothetical protein
MMTDLAVTGSGIGAAMLQRVLIAWSVLGAVSVEVFEGFGSEAFADPDLFFEAVLELGRAHRHGREPSSSNRNRSLPRMNMCA